MEQIEQVEGLRCSDVTVRLGISGMTVTTWRRSGKLKALRTPLGYLYDLACVEALKREREANPPRPGRKKRVA